MPTNPFPLRADVVILTVIPVELEAVLSALGISLKDSRKDPRNGTVSYRGVLRSSLSARDLEVVVTCIAGAGNAGAAGLAAEMARAFEPSRMLLVGIAAGMEKKNRIGQVVFAERIVGYESAALVAKKGGGREEQRRPEIIEIPHTIKQDVAGFQINVERLLSSFKALGWEIPHEAGWDGKVVRMLTVTTGVTIASGEKLLRDPTKLREVRRDVHGKVEVGEMEAHGFAKSCEQQGVPWLVIRGISDFGNSFKDDRFHALAARTAAVATVDFLKWGLRLPDAVSPQGAVTPEQRLFVWGRPIDRDEDLHDRDVEKRLLTHSLTTGVPTELLGGALVGKSSLLQWVERHGPADRPLVRLEKGAGLSPVGLVATIAERLGDSALAELLRRKNATWETAQEALVKLVPFTLLVDDADKLAKAGKGFDDAFLSCMRGLVEERRILWVSASDRPLHEVFKEKKLSSDFLTSSEKIWLGPLEKDAAAKIAEQAGPTLSKRILEEAGGFAFGLQWLGDRMRRAPEDIDAIIDEYREDMGRIFATWCEHLSPRHKQMLQRCAAKPFAAQGDERSILNQLAKRKLIVQENGVYRLTPGEAWGRFVQNAW